MNNALAKGQKATALGNSTNEQCTGKGSKGYCFGKPHSTVSADPWVITRDENLMDFQQSFVSTKLTAKHCFTLVHLLFSELASIHIEHPTKVNLLPSGATSTTATTTTTATPTSSSGRISIRGNTESYLSLTWSSVNSTEEGIYSCVAQGLDNLGHLVTMTSSSLVKRGSDLERFKLSLEKVRQTLEPVQNKIISGFQALRQATAPVAGLEPATEGSLQISGRVRYPSCNQTPLSVKEEVYSLYAPSLWLSPVG
ncbi:hypothetical protein PoB_006187600 [Plakobranchus ocellatus]|uniref:Ig-like domain-containing protein n=1 Tax=Plakobranchus ocellatus TaxID=259542 RepID=A0AAV4CUK8_9GAST|nr:hypothetical protein PoB_006187600 [Plakobranchus ocellatus]